MRILIFISSLGPGGAERVTVNLARYWAAAGHTVRLVTLDSGAMDAYAIPETVTRASLGLKHADGTLFRRSVANLRRGLALRGEMKRFECDVAVGMITMSNVQVALAAVGLGCGTIGSERTSPGHWPIRTPWKLLRWACYGLLDLVITQTGAAAEWVEAHTLAKRVRVIPNAAVEPVGGDRVVCPDAVCLPDRRLLLAAGSLVGLKGFDKLIRAFERLAGDHPDWDLVILGEGPHRSALENLAKEFHLAPRIHLPGRVDNMSTWYRRSSVFALTSDFEGFPNVLVEALAHGVPSVALDCPEGPREILRGNRGGLLVPTDDPDALVDALTRLMDDGALRQEMARAALAVNAVYSQDRVMAQWSSALDEACLAADRRARGRGHRAL